MRRFGWLALVLLLVAAPAAAKEPRCPLDLTTCLNQFNLMRTRPWLGVKVDVDSAGNRIIREVVPGSPAEAAGFQPGDILRRIDGMDPPKWFAGKAGWKDGDVGKVAVVRDGHDASLKLTYSHIPEDVLARVIGTHMIEGHLAWAGVPEGEEPHEH